MSPHLAWKNATSLPHSLEMQTGKIKCYKSIALSLLMFRPGQQMSTQRCLCLANSKVSSSTCQLKCLRIRCPKLAPFILQYSTNQKQCRFCAYFIVMKVLLDTVPKNLIYAKVWKFIALFIYSLENIIFLIIRSHIAKPTRFRQRTIFVQ